MTRAVFFDVDFTLIFPGPMFRGEGYRAFCARHGMDVDASTFADAVASAAPLLNGPEDAPYDAEIFVAYTRHIIEQMGGRGPELDACARDIYAEWAACRHFELYDEVPEVLRTLATSGVRIGLISNSHRCLASFQSHFELQGLIAATVSSSEHGFMKPHASIFSAALQLVGARPDEAVMVGDSMRHDVEGALRAGMRAVLLHRGRPPVLSNLTLRPFDQLRVVLSHVEGRHAQGERVEGPARAAELGVPVIRSLRELSALIIR